MNRPLVTLCLGLAAAGVAACNGTEPPPVDTGDPPECTQDDACGQNEICVDEVCELGDRDDDFEGARTLFKSASLDDPSVRTGLIHTPGDIDHYVHNAVEAGWVRISTITDDGEDSLDTVISVFRADGTLHHVMDEYPSGSISTYDSRMQVYLPEAGPWYVRVEDRSTFYGEDVQRGNPTFSYRLGLEDWSSVSEEPDAADDPSVRFPMESGSIVYAWGVRMEEAGDIDWTTADMPWADAPVELYAPESIPGSDLVPVVTLTDPDGEVHLRKEDIGATGNASTFSSPDTRFTVSVTDADGEGGDDHWTVLYLRTRAEGFGNPREVEPNDTAEDATPLDPETRTDGGVTTDRHFLQGKLTTEGDVDLFRFGARAGGRLRLVCSSDSFGALGDVDVDLLDPDGAVVTTLTDGDDLAPDGEVEDLVDGAYTLRFYTKDGAFGPGVYYRCGVYADRP